MQTNKPMHDGSSDGRAGGSRLKGPEIENPSVSYDTQWSKHLNV